MAYDLASMRRAIAKCDENVAVFKAAIAKEIATKLEYEMIVVTLEQKASMLEAARHATVELVEDEDGDLD